MVEIYVFFSGLISGKKTENGHIFWLRSPDEFSAYFLKVPLLDLYAAEIQFITLHIFAA